MASNRELIKSDAKLRIMRLLQDNPELTTRQLAEAVGISHGSAYYVVAALIEKGFIKLGNFSRNPRKRQYTYLLTSKGVREKTKLTKAFIERKRFEYERLLAEIDLLEKELGTEASRSLEDN